MNFRNKLIAFVSFATVLVIAFFWTVFKNWVMLGEEGQSPSDFVVYGIGVVVCAVILYWLRKDEIE